jgi:hypothetical protein
MAVVADNNAKAYSISFIAKKKPLPQKVGFYQISISPQHP